MFKISSKKSNLIFVSLLVGAIFFFSYRDNLFPFSDYITIDLAVHKRFATTRFFELGKTQWAHEYYYPRLFVLPFFIIYEVFGLRVDLIAYLMFFTMILFLYLSAYFIFYRLNSHSAGLVLTYLFVVNGDFSNVVGVFFLLFLIENPNLRRMLILGFGYPPFIVYTLPYLFFIGKKHLACLGGGLVVFHSFLARNKIFFTWDGFNPQNMRGFDIYSFILIVSFFFIYFLFILSKKDKMNNEIVLPATTIIVGLFLFLVRVDFYWIVKSLILFPIFVTISDKSKHY